MFSFKTFFSKYHFATRKVDKTCRERKRIYPFLKAVFIQNLQNMGNILLKTDLKFTSLLAYNYTYFNIDEDELRRLMIENVKHRLHDMTPELAYDICVNLRELINVDDLGIYEAIYDYAQENHYLFTARQLEAMERVYYLLSQKATYGFNPIFGEILSAAKNNLKVDPLKKTKAILENLEIPYPKEHLDIQIHPEDRIVYIKFKKLNKTLALVGLYHKDWESIKIAREHLEKRHYDFYFLEMPPLTQSVLKRNQNLKKESILKKFIGDELLSEVGDIKKRHPYLSFFDRFERLPLLDARMLDWYIDNVLKNEEIFRIRESERIVSSSIALILLMLGLY